MIDQANKNATAGRLLLKGNEVAALLGISTALAYKWMASGILPTVKIEGSTSIRVPREGLLRWVEEHTKPAKAA